MKVAVAAARPYSPTVLEAKPIPAQPSGRSGSWELVAGSLRSRQPSTHPVASEFCSERIGRRRIEAHQIRRELCIGAVRDHRSKRLVDGLYQVDVALLDGKALLHAILVVGEGHLDRQTG